MRVLIACETSGQLRRRFYEQGHDVISCDLLPCDDPEHESAAYHYEGDVFELVEQAGGFDLMIAHPPCTYLCSSGMHWTTRGLRDPRLTEEAIAFAERLWDLPIPRKCIENPVGCLSTRSKLGKASQYVHPYQFGDDASKTTGLWLDWLPPLVPTCNVPPRMVNGYKRWGNQGDNGRDKLSPSPDRWKLRSKTFDGIADAMVDQWGRLEALPC